MIRMKALRSGNIGPGGEKIKRSREFDVETAQRADELESHGLAHRVNVKSMPPLQNKMESPLRNKAADEGPFDKAGGQTGEAAPAQSLPRAPVRRGRRSGGSGGGLLS